MPTNEYSPKRKISTNSRGVTGVFPGVGRYESSLERDVFELFSFDSSVKAIYPQPVTVPYIRKDGSEGFYTPDGLVIFKDDVTRPILYEIKYREDLKAERVDIFPKLRGARAYAFERNWRFHLYTEKEIRTPYLINVRFLSRFKSLTLAQPSQNFILDLLYDCGEVAISYFLTMLGDNKQEQANILPYIWLLIAKGIIACDMNEKITMDTLIYLGDA